MLVGLGLALLLMGGALAGYLAIAKDLPHPDELQARASQFASTFVYDRSGELLYEMSDREHGRRTVVELGEISPYLIDATIATEDPNFYRHAGVDPVGLARALYYAVRQGNLSGPGGSTITQQLVKLTFLSSEKTIARKVREAILAAEITRRYPKETVLQIYLNEIHYGHLAYGIEAAAETYFGKPASQLDLAEAALLAGLPQGPNYYDPYNNLWEADGTPGPTKERQGIVLTLMVRNGYISPGQADAAWAESLQLAPLEETYEVRHPHFVRYALQSVEQALGPELASKGGLRIYTTLDPALQELALTEVSGELSALAEQGAGNAAVVAIRPETGELLVMVGSADFWNEEISGQINMALSPRQPGSAIKPLTYLAAFEMPSAEYFGADGKPLAGVSAIEPPGYWTPATALMDITTSFPDGVNPPYVPDNYDGREHGLVSVRSALANSYNIPAVKALEHVGLKRLIELATRLGVTTLTREDYGLSLTLGGGDVTLLELTGAYAALATGGVRVAPSPIACVLDADGMLIWRGYAYAAVDACAVAPIPASGSAVTAVQPQTVVDPRHAYLITSILSDLEARRPMFGASAELLGLSDRPAAAKTGTTNDFRDGWTVGYTPDLAVGVWVGNADYREMKAISGVRGAAPIWHRVMAGAHSRLPVRDFVEPAGIERIQVCAVGGAIPGPHCPSVVEEIFAEGQGPLPAEFDLHQNVRVDRLTGLPATPYTPEDRVETRQVLAFPDKYRQWAEENGYPQLLTAVPSYHFEPELVIDSPYNGESLSGLVSVFGHVRVPEPLVWRLEYGVGPDPIGWGVLAGPAAQDISGELATWDADGARDRHEALEFSLRLAAYDVSLSEYPVAASDTLRVSVQAELPITAAPPVTTPTTEHLLGPTQEPISESTVTPPSSEPASPTPTPTSGVWPPTAPTSSPGEAPVHETTADEVTIRSPLEGARISGLVDVLGTADVADFYSYELLYGAGDAPEPDVWQTAAGRRFAPVSEGVLATWDTSQLSPGRYTLRLLVETSTGALFLADRHIDVLPAG